MLLLLFSVSRGMSQFQEAWVMFHLTPSQVQLISNSRLVQFVSVMRYLLGDNQSSRWQHPSVNYSESSIVWHQRFWRKSKTRESNKMVSSPKIELSDIYWQSFIHMETSTKVVNFLICYFEGFGAVYSETLFL